jgi:translation initiation factor IF-3
LPTQHRVNQQIRSQEVRVIGPQGENFGVMSTSEAIQKAIDIGMDLVEISPNTVPPITKIVDYGKFLYTESKKQKAAKAKAVAVEIKSLQIKVGTGDHDLELKAKKASEWLKEGNRVKIDLFLQGRTKYMDPKFLEERLARVLKLITVEYKSEKPVRGPKGLTVLVEKVR